MMSFAASVFARLTTRYICRLIGAAASRENFDVEVGFSASASASEASAFRRYVAAGSAGGMRSYALAAAGVLVVLVLIVLVGMPLNTWN